MLRNSRLLFLNSKDCQGSNLTWFFSDPQMANIPQCNILVEQVVLTNMFYPINSNNNVLTIQDSANNIGYLQLPYGEYSGSSICSALQSLVGAPLTCTLSFTYSTVTNCITITSTNAVSFQVISSPLAQSLGFSNTTLLNTQAIGDYPINISGPSFIDLYTSLSLSSVNTSGFSTLARIPLNFPFNSLITWEPQERAIIHQLTQRSITFIQIELRGSDGTVLSLPKDGLFSIVLKLEY